MQSKSFTYSPKWIYFLLVVLSFVLYGNTIRNGYGLDDEFVVTSNNYVQKGIAGIPEILDKPYAQFGETKLDKRPIALISFAMEHQFIGDNPHVSHFINIVLYALCLMALYSFLTRVLNMQQVHPVLPLLTVVLYAIHPLHTEVVASLKNRDELFGLLFGLLFLMSAVRFFETSARLKKYAWLALSFILLILCVMSKLTGVVFLGILVLLVIFKDFHRKFTWRSYVYIALFFIWVMVRLLLTFRDINRPIVSFENNLEVNGNLAVMIATSLKILLYHIKMLLIPYPLRFYYGYNMFPVSGFFNVASIVSLVLHAALLVVGLGRFFKRELLGLFILGYFVSVILYANFPIPYTGMFSERALLISSFWFIGAGLMVFFQWMKPYASASPSGAVRKSALLVFVLIFAGYSFLTIQRNFYWKDNLTLMERDIPYLEKSVLGNYMYANNLRVAAAKSSDSAFSRQLAMKAVTYYQRTIELAPLYPEFYFKLASTYRYALKEPENAILHYKNAIATDTLYTFAYYELGKLYFDLQDYRNSYRYLAEAYSLNYKDSLTLFYLAQAAEFSGDMPTCLRINQEFVNLYPDLQYPYLNLGRYYSKLQRDDSAVIYLEKAIELGNRDPALLQQMSVYYQNRKEDEKAAYFRRLLN